MSDLLIRFSRNEGRNTLERDHFLPILAMVICGIVLVFALWIDTFSRFQEFEHYIDPYKTEIYFFLPISVTLVLVFLLVAKRWGVNLLPISVLTVLFVGAALGGATSSEQNEHRYGTDRNGPTSIEDIASASPQIRARETFLTYMQLNEFLENKTVYVDLDNPYSVYLHSFSRANVKVDEGFEHSIIPFDRMAGMEMVVERPIYQDRKLFLFGQGNSYRFFRAAQIDYLVAD